jgi:enoyl-CoA hydratase
MAFRNLLAADRGGIRTLTVNRPDKLNALDRQTIAELQIAFDQARYDDAVRVVVLTGAGEKAFVAGADIAEFSALSPIQARTFAQAGQRMTRSIETLGKPVIARLGGYALGGGLELAMACHLRIASTRARLGQPEINLGLIPGFGGTQRLARLAGRAAALELCLLGTPIEAARALQLGVVNRVVEPDALDGEVEAIATQLAAAAPLALAGILDTVLAAGDLGIEDGLEYEAKAFGLCFATADAREGTAAFLERRKPSFGGS